MNDIDKMPVKCRDCPYWEIATYPWCCGDCKDIMNPKNGEYIKRIDAKRALTALSADMDAETVQRCIEAMNNLKAADVEPKRKTGHWIKEGDDAMCSVCDEILCGEAWEDLDPIDDIGLHYCPNCGSRMLHEPPKEEDPV